MFILESTLDGAAPIIEKALMTDSEAGAYGELVVFSSGRLTKCGATALPIGILVQTTGAGTDVETEFIRIRDDAVYLADFTGTDPVVGTLVYQIDSTGLLVNGAQASGGKVRIVSVNAAKDKCRVMFTV